MPEIPHAVGNAPPNVGCDSPRQGGDFEGYA